MTTPVLDRAFSALSDPTRREIVQRLAKGATRVTDLAEPFDMSLNAVSKHVKVLERAGLVRRTRMGRDRKSTRLNSSHSQISYAVFCLKKKKKKQLYILTEIKKKKNYNK